MEYQRIIPFLAKFGNSFCKGFNLALQFIKSIWDEKLCLTVGDKWGTLVADRVYVVNVTVVTAVTFVTTLNIFEMPVETGIFLWTFAFSCDILFLITVTYLGWGMYLCQTRKRKKPRKELIGFLTRKAIG